MTRRLTDTDLVKAHFQCQYTVALAISSGVRAQEADVPNKEPMILHARFAVERERERERERESTESDRCLARLATLSCRLVVSSRRPFFPDVDSAAAPETTRGCRWVYYSSETNQGCRWVYYSSMHSQSIDCRAGKPFASGIL